MLRAATRRPSRVTETAGAGLPVQPPGAALLEFVDDVAMFVGHGGSTDDKVCVDSRPDLHQSRSRRHTQARTLTNQLQVMHLAWRARSGCNRRRMPNQPLTRL
jgi:hypothetical protein